MKMEKGKMAWNERESENGKGNLFDNSAIPQNENGKRKRSSLKNQTQNLRCRCAGKDLNSSKTSDFESSDQMSVWMLNQMWMGCWIWLEIQDR